MFFTRTISFHAEVCQDKSDTHSEAIGDDAVKLEASVHDHNTLQFDVNDLCGVDRIGQRCVRLMKHSISGD
jgi:hypothetical protein